jgi:enoyl-CoA hydratase
MNGFDSAGASGDAPLIATRVGNVVILELSRPHLFNCLSTPAFEAIDAALDRFLQPAADIRALLVCAQGRHFCTGADLDEVLPLRKDPPALANFISRAHRVLNRLEAADVPVVSACQGLSLAGGLELMLACDVAFAARDARFGDQHAQYGLLPGFGASQRLPRLIGVRRSMDLFLSARWINADTALSWGLVNYVVESGALRDSALSYCETIGSRSRAGLALTKRMVREGLEMAPREGLAMEERLVPGGLLHEDVTEGLDAFRARRPPRFRTYSQ